MFSLLYLWYRKNSRKAVIGLILSCVTSVPVMAQSQNNWTLKNSILRAIEVAPETRGAQAAVNARQGALKQAGAWPNPQIELRTDNKIGKDEGAGGFDFTQFAFSQPLPLSGRIGHQQSIARSMLNAARTDHQYKQVLLETKVALHYHTLQLAVERLHLAKLRLQLADNLQSIGRRRATAGELSKLERLRLDLIRESAQQIMDKAEGAYNEALSQFRAYLGLPSTVIIKLTPLRPFGPIPDLKQLIADLTKHAKLQTAQHQLKSARLKVNLARAERFPDLTLSLFNERDFLNGRRQNVTGIGLSISVPLWDRNSGRIDEALAQSIQSQSKLQVIERDLGTRLLQGYLHLNHLIQQGEHYRTRVLKPAKKVFELSRKAYAGGELGILSLIDANNTYFNARERYLELLQEAWLEASEVRLAAGRSLVKNKLDTDHE